MKKMNKSYILTALGVVGSSLLNAPASADLFKCVACTNAPEYAYYVTGSADIKYDDDCHWECGKGFTKNESANKCECIDGHITAGGCCAKNSSSSSSSSGNKNEGRACSPSHRCDEGEYAGCTCPDGQRCYNGYCQTR